MGNLGTEPNDQGGGTPMFAVLRSSVLDQGAVKLKSALTFDFC